MPKFTHVVETFLWDRATWQMPDDYLLYRLEFFKRYTLQSLNNQTLSNFLIFLQLGDKHRNITEQYDMPENVIKCYDGGINEYKSINTPYLIVSRIDSDDLYRRTAIDRIRKNIIFDKRKRTVAVFRDNICWDQVNGCIMPHRKATSPFFTHVFPKRIYRDWDRFYEQHFKAHGNHGAGDRQGKELPPGQVCVIKHGQNVSHMKRDKPPFVLTDDQKEILMEIGKSDSVMSSYDYAIWDKERMSKILKKFGVENEI